MSRNTPTSVTTTVLLPALALAGALLTACSPQASSPAAAASSPAAATAAAHPDFSGYWNLDMKVPVDPELMSKVAPGTVLLTDTGPAEFPRGEYGGLKLKPAALEKARKWDPKEQLSIHNVCRAPSIIYAMQGPFPIEIFQGERFIIMKLEYYDMVRIIFMDGRKADANYPHSMEGFSTGHWEGSTLVVNTDHLEAATITNNGLDHTQDARVIERFKLSADGRSLLATQEFEDPAVLDNRGVRFIAWTRQPGQHVYPYDCDPSFAGNYK